MFAFRRILGNAVDEPTLDPEKIVVNNVVRLYHMLCERRVALDVCVDALRDHLSCGVRHFREQLFILRAARIEKSYDFCNILRLVSDALHVGDHFERGEDPARPAAAGE